MHAASAFVCGNDIPLYQQRKFRINQLQVLQKYNYNFPFNVIQSLSLNLIAIRAICTIDILR